MSDTNIKSFLAKIELFQGLNDEEMEIIASLSALVEYPKGKVLFEEYNPRKNVFLVYSGEIQLYKTTPFGEERHITQFEKYDFIGEASVVDNSPHSTSARALSDAKVYKIKSVDLVDVLNNEAKIAVKILSRIAQIISRRMTHSNDRLSSVGAQYVSGRTRVEHDLLGERNIPSEYLYGVQTIRAKENFNISGVTLRFYPDIIVAFAMVKKAAALSNNEIGLLNDEITKAISFACDELIAGKHHKHFVVDMIQGGAGTSTNMNANEVIANLALEYLGKERGDYDFCHPNNHVNLSQSTNDAYPTAVKIALKMASEKLIENLKLLVDSFQAKADEFMNVIKMGRTQLQDAVPMTLGQEFGAYAELLREEIERITTNADLLLFSNMGATAIGTGLNAHPDYSDACVKYMREITQLDVTLAENLVEATQDTGSFIMFSSALKRLAVKLSKIMNDLRLLSSGPRAGLNEINLPAVQPGSSIMPGKVNPVIPEVVNQIAFKVIGNDITVTLAAEAGQLELNVMEPVIVESLFESIEMLKNGMRVLRLRTIDGITANKEHLENMVRNSIGIVTALNPYIGYENSSSIAKEALATGKSVYDITLERGLLSEAELKRILSPENMITNKRRK